jgi:hypothetical protein
LYPLPLISLAISTSADEPQLSDMWLCECP